MAFVCCRIVLQVKPTCTTRRLLNPIKYQSAQSVYVVPTANLTSVRSHEAVIERPKPWPYEKRPYNAFWQFFDHTTKRFNDNTRVILIDGNLSSGKSEFAEKMAKEFDMKFFPDLLDKEIFEKEGFDFKEFNPQMSPEGQCLDIDTFNMHTSHPECLKTIGRTQLQLYRERFFNYVRALEHMFNTGQGVIVERSPWSDVVFADTLRKFGYISRAGLNFYNKWRDNSICELWKPHIVVYLDAPVSSIRKRITERNNPAEVKGKVITDDYLKSIEDVYKNKVLPNHKKHSFVLTYNLDEMPEWDIVVEDFESLVFDNEIEEREELFPDWQKVREDDWNFYRQWVSAKHEVTKFFVHPLPLECPEMVWSGDSYLRLRWLVAQYPESFYKKGFAPRKAFTIFK